MAKGLQANAVHGLFRDAAKKRIPQLAKEGVAKARGAIRHDQQQHYLQR